ncbi:ribonuclease P protein component 1 [Candidatus Bathyarchaeota archaeon]|jgi:ribonuclease P protein subunit POP4|nr:ribonuclease P protein component 1 [Candidatus Bathyarchaeota archaeon]
MRVTPHILQHEFIGLDIEVARSPNPYYVGITGRVIDETHNTLVIQYNSEKKIIIKDVTVFHFTMPDGTIVEIDGKAIIGRPEKRIKRRIRKRW